MYSAVFYQGDPFFSFVRSFVWFVVRLVRRSSGSVDPSRPKNFFGRYRAQKNFKPFFWFGRSRFGRPWTAENLGENLDANLGKFSPVSNSFRPFRTRFNKKEPCIKRAKYSEGPLQTFSLAVPNFLEAPPLRRRIHRPRRRWFRKGFARVLGENGPKHFSKL